ncbi:MAG: hypothetical protein DYG92_10260, partial [Leptolyngbya sp. PLA1]|nr:hypothetical protein [Leptolyngbya sp. PLA1]
ARPGPLALPAPPAREHPSGHAPQSPEVALSRPRCLVALLSLTLLAAVQQGCASKPARTDSQQQEIDQWNARKRERWIDIWGRHLSSRP